MLPFVDDLAPAASRAGADLAATGLRERKKQQARAAIADAALELFAEQGYDDTTVAQVAARAGVSTATVARYFPTKESLLFPSASVKAPELRAAVLARPATESPFDAVVACLSAGTGLDDPARRRLLLSRQAIARSPVLRGRASTLMHAWRDTIADAAAERGASPDEARVLAAVVVAVLDDTADRWAQRGGVDDLADVIGDAFTALERTHRRNP